MSTDIQLQPSEDEVLQAETPMDESPVKVMVVGPVRTQDLPRKSGATRFVIAPTLGIPVRALSSDHRRAIGRLISSAPFFVAYGFAAAADTSRMWPQPANLALTINADSDVWVQGSAAGQIINIITESWAAGE